MANLKDYYVVYNNTQCPDCSLCDMWDVRNCPFKKCPLEFGYYFAKRDNG